jgi:hypothetical protein
MSQFKPHCEALKILSHTQGVSNSLGILATMVARKSTTPEKIEDCRQSAIHAATELRRQCRRLIRKLIAARVIRDGGAA